MSLILRFAAKAAICAIFAFSLAHAAMAQGSAAVGTPVKTPPQVPAALPTVTQIDVAGLKALLKPNGKPLIINFWATWCEPCREEFPDLVKLDEAYRGRVDIITVSLDDLADIKTSVPKFLAEMKSVMPSYLLKTPDESAAIAMVSRDWAGNLPMTVLYDITGKMTYSRNGKIRYAAITAEIDKLLVPPVTGNLQFELPKNPAGDHTFERGVAEAQRDIAAGNYRIIRYGLTAAIAPGDVDRLRQKYLITVVETGCVIPAGYPDYARGYNETTRTALKEKFGEAVLADTAFAGDL